MIDKKYKTKIMDISSYQNKKRKVDKGVKNKNGTDDSQQKEKT